MPLAIIFIISCLALIVFIFIFKIIICIYPYFFNGAIYVSISEAKIKKMLELLKISPGQDAIDLGSGDGRLVIAMARAGANACGCEINKFLVFISRKNIKKAGLGDSAHIYCKNLWNQDLKDFDVVVIYPMTHMMKRLEEKFAKELKPGAKVAIKHFALPTWKPARVEDDVYLYIKG